MPQPPAGNYGTPPSYSGYDTSGSTYGVTAPQLSPVYPAQSLYGQ